MCVLDKLSLYLRKTNKKVGIFLSAVYRGAILCLRSVFSATTDYRGMTQNSVRKIQNGPYQQCNTVTS